ncbi:MAG: T9SS type A sorting domain-containing protein, partial [Ignavibacteriaceae bacterium]|nr:T9SS type A sorting domain-containing protein [Ignavibacteriaceae bacterium]
TNTGNAELLILGGFNEGNSALNSVEKFIFRSASITSQFFPPMNIKRKNFNSVLLGDNVYVFGGRNEFGQTVRDIEKFQLLTSAEDLIDEKPKSFLLEQNYPNPFNPSTKIVFQMQSSENVSILIFDILGNKVKHLVNETFQKGEHEITWDGSGDLTNSLPSGVYIYQLRTSTMNLFGKMILQK